MYCGKKKENPDWYILKITHTSQHSGGGKHSRIAASQSVSYFLREEKVKNYYSRDGMLAPKCL